MVPMPLAIQPPIPDQITGCGCRMVSELAERAELADRCGSERTKPGKTVRFELALVAAAPSDPR